MCQWGVLGGLVWQSFSWERKPIDLEWMHSLIVCKCVYSECEIFDNHF